MSIISHLNWRYATKKLNQEKVDPKKVERIIEAARLAPTSNGLQPFEIFVISNQQLKEKIHKIAFNQSQITDCSHLLVFCAWDKYTIDRIDNYFTRYESERNLEKGYSNTYKTMLTKQLTSWLEQRQFEHTSKQAYIAMSFAMVEAAALRVDSCPMEGFVNEELDKLLELESKGLKSVLILPIGYRDHENDWQTNQKKVRKSHQEIIHYIE